jgi:hypothetical protein
VVSAGAYVRYRSVWDSIRRIDVTGLGHRPAKYNNGLNVLLIGSDSLAGQNRRFRAGIQGQRSDTIMLLHISPDHHHVTVVSIPRDTVVGSINDIGGVRICLPAAISDRDFGAQPGGRRTSRHGRAGAGVRARAAHRATAQAGRVRGFSPTYWPENPCPLRARSARGAVGY